MILKDINTIKANQEELKRCNKILEDNWTDSSADQFKTTYLGPIEAVGTAFVAESFVHGQTLRRHLQELEELMFQLGKLKNELSDICQHPSWEGCAIGIVDGRTPENETYGTQEFFVLTKEEVPLLNDEDELLRIAETRVTNIVELENARFHMPIH